MHKRSSVVGLMLMLLIAAVAWAQQPANATTVRGRITSIDTTDRTVTIETATGKLTFKTDAQTMFMQRDARKDMSDFKVGDQVEVSYTGQEPDMVAAHIHTVDGAIVSPGSTTTGTTATTTVSSSTVTGRVTYVDASGRRATIDTPTGSRTFTLGPDARILARDGSTDFASIRTGDQVRVQLTSDSRTISRIEYVDDGNANETTASRQQLPRTASPLPLLGLLGLGMIGAALALRMRRVRAS
jgi:uncharacterized protein DUF5666